MVKFFWWLAINQCFSGNKLILQIVKKKNEKGGGRLITSIALHALRKVNLDDWFGLVWFAEFPFSFPVSFTSLIVIDAYHSSGKVCVLTWLAGPGPKHSLTTVWKKCVVTFKEYVYLCSCYGYCRLGEVGKAGGCRLLLLVSPKACWSWGPSNNLWTEWSLLLCLKSKTQVCCSMKTLLIISSVFTH